jgi:glycosyltransferase involved in cell wall biosynthesis
MRVITVITRLNIGGASPPVIAQAAGLKARGHDSLLVCGTPQRHEGSMEEDARRAGADVLHFPPLCRNPGARTDARALAGLHALFRKSRPDVVSTHMSKAGAIGRVAARAAGVPVVVHTYHGKGFHVFSSRWKERAALLAERALGRLSTANIVVSEKQRAEFVSLGIAPDRLRVIRYGLDLDVLMCAGAAPLHAELALPPSVRLVGVVARVVAIKGQDVLLRAAARLRPSYPDVHYVIAGDGDARAFCETLASELQLADRVHFLGWRRDVPALLRSLSVAVLPTVLDFEGTPLAVIEAMAAGRPVVATDVGGVAEVVRNGETGLLIPPRDDEALARAIDAQLSNTAAAASMAAAGQRLVAGLYRKQRMVDETEALFLELVGGQARKRNPGTH